MRTLGDSYAGRSTFLTHCGDLTDVAANQARLFARFPRPDPGQYRNAVHNAITHSAHAAPGYFRVAFDEVRVALQHLRRSLTNDEEAHGDSLSASPIGEELFLTHSPNKAAGI